MRRFILLAATLLMSSLSFASLDKGSDALKSLGSAFKKQTKVQNTASNEHNMNMVYGGADLNDKTSLASSISAS
jgi:hypothetical protein